MAASDPKPVTTPEPDTASLDLIERRDELIARLRHDLDAAGRRLSDEVVRRRAAEVHVTELEARLA